jgi:hypothetical protein
MKRWIPVVLLFELGCIGDAALPIVSTTPLPGTPFTVNLGGPDTKGNYGSHIWSGRNFTYRPLGRLRPDQTAPVALDDLGGGVFRVRWGNLADGPYAVIDTRNQRIIEDSNEANPKNVPFARRPE